MHEKPDHRDRAHRAYVAVHAGWARWEAQFVAFTWPVTLRLVLESGARPGMRILDLGSGTGEPALALATAVGPTGRVTAVDFTNEMLNVARERAAALKIQHVDFVHSAIEDLNFPAASFDAVVSRWGLIFAADVPAQLRRIRAWLRPAGRIALATWTPMENSPGFQAVNTAVSRVLNLPPPNPDEPGMQNLSRAGALAEALRAAGFSDIGAELIHLATIVRSGSEYWQLSLDTGASLRAVLDRLKPEQLAALEREVAEAVEPFRSGELLRIPALAQVGWGRA